jgi:hypothetical protein
MAEAEDNTGVGVDLKTGFGSLKLVGANGILVLIFISILGDIGNNIYENRMRQAEHTQTQCMIKLNLFVGTMAAGEKIDWNKMPVDLYPCIPRFLYQRNSNE